MSRGEGDPCPVRSHIGDPVQWGPMLHRLWLRGTEWLTGGQTRLKTLPACNFVGRRKTLLEDWNFTKRFAINLTYAVSWRKAKVSFNNKTLRWVHVHSMAKTSFSEPSESDQWVKRYCFLGRPLSVSWYWPAQSSSSSSSFTNPAAPDPEVIFTSHYVYSRNVELKIYHGSGTWSIIN